MHIINLVGKPLSWLRNYCTVGTTGFENIAVRNGKKHSHNKVTYISNLQLKQTIIQEDHNIHTMVYYTGANLKKLFVSYHPHCKKSHPGGR